MASTTRLTPESLQQELAAFEERYGLASADFLEQYQAGKMGDSRDVMRWAWLCSVSISRRPSEIDRSPAAVTG